MRDIGIVGGGISGLHLGIRLLDLGVSATIYHPQTVEEIEQGRILNSVVHQHDTVLREQAMGIDFWNEGNCRVGRGHDHCLNIPGLDPIRFWGAFTGFGKGVDYRMLIPRLMTEFGRRGGTLVHATKAASDLPDLQAQIQARALADQKLNARLHQLAETGRLHTHAVVAGRQQRHIIGAVRPRLNGAHGSAGFGIGQSNLSIGQGGPTRVGNSANQLRGGHLCRRP
jgi:hypothetical protein